MERHTSSNNNIVPPGQGNVLENQQAIMDRLTHMEQQEKDH
ncbi:uncharacterized protein G2W53_007960 [Senna tora]|uniref:Uncharacterized protein n=1 Tax=Senna tora TaxID=362788 RepID=A0A834X7M3_9FABA|nr:uncharacterized protein G2W53_007960 [Senna tora]